MSIQSWFSSKPYWLKGGIIGGIISIILSVIFVPCVIILVGVPGTICLFPIWPGVWLFWTIQNYFYFSLGNGEVVVMNIFNLFIWLSTGTFIGWLVDKIKD